MNFRPAGNFSNFSRNLSSLKGKEDSLLLWQTIQGKKKTLKGTFVSVTKIKSSRVVEIETNKNYSFDQKEEIFIYEEGMGLLFKGQYEFCVNRKLKIIIDDKVFLKENRRAYRFSFQFTSVIAELEKNEKSESLEFCDVNEFGFSVVTSARLAKNFKLGEEIGLASIHGVKFPTSIKAIVVHLSPTNNKSRKVQIGLKFKKKSRLFGIVIKDMGLN